MLFDDLQPIEYGWVPTIDEKGYHHGVATRRSLKGMLLTELLRADRTPQWKRKTEKLLFKIGKRFGTPMDHAREEMRDFRKLRRRSAELAFLRNPFGVAYPLTLKDKLFEGDLWTAENQNSSWFWFPKTDYSTESFRIEENLTDSVDMRGLIKDLYKDTHTESFEDLPEKVKEEAIEAMNKLSHTKGVFVIRKFVWLPWSQEPEQKWGNEHHEECLRYQASKAGRKAKRLLLENLTPQQEEDYWKKGYFFVVPRTDLPMEKRRIYVIERSFAGGNVRTVRRRRILYKRWREQGEYWVPTSNLCFHTKEPYAVDDILLAQKLTLEEDEDAFRAGANITPVMAARPLDYAKRSV